MSYSDTFINVASHCPVSESEITVSIRALTPIHILQYNILIQNPFKFGKGEFNFEIHLRKNDLNVLFLHEKGNEWDKVFSKGHPCMRASSFKERYSFGAHY